ncbi:MAG: flippase-like domain-containing protein [Bacteroidia bacterium]|nr:flippase-like domain-containing protein [Bacteroidia bacterium]
MKAEQPYIKKIILIVKFALLPITFGFIFYKLYYAYHLKTLWNESGFEWNIKSVGLLSVTLALMLLNWLLEVWKWKLLVQKYEPISFFEAIKGVLSGVALNMITPNQLGDFVGRVIHLKKLDKVRGTLVTVIGHTAQVIMTLGFGLIALIWFLQHNNTINSSQTYWAYFTLVICVVITIMLYFNMRLLSNLKLTARIKPYLDVFKLYNKTELLMLLVLSFTRYVVFLLQYYLLLVLFNVDIQFSQAMACVVGTLCVQSFVPSFILVEIGMRGASALWFFSMFTNQITPVLLSAYSLWIINLMLPGLLGLVYILRWRQAK